MPTYEFQCVDCAESEDYYLSISEVEEEMDLPCTYCPTSDDLRVTPHVRIIGPVSIGVVSGAGGSPAR